MKDHNSEDQPPDSGVHTRRVVTVFTAVTAALIVVTAVASLTAYGLGDGVIYIEDKTISDLTFLEVTSGTAVGIFGAVFALGAAAIGGIAALITAVLSAGFGLFGLVVGALVAVGVVTGPLLLIAAIALVIKRRFWPDVI